MPRLEYLCLDDAARKVASQNAVLHNALLEVPKVKYLLRETLGKCSLFPTILNLEIVFPSFILWRKPDQDMESPCTCCKMWHQWDKPPTGFVFVPYYRPSPLCWQMTTVHHLNLEPMNSSVVGFFCGHVLFSKPKKKVKIPKTRQTPKFPLKSQPTYIHSEKSSSGWSF